MVTTAAGQYKHFKEAIQSALVQYMNTEDSLNECRMLLKSISSVHVPAAYKAFQCNFVRSILLSGILTFSSRCQRALDTH